MSFGWFAAINPDVNSSAVAGAIFLKLIKT